MINYFVACRLNRVRMSNTGMTFPLWPTDRSSKRIVIHIPEREEKIIKGRI